MSGIGSACTWSSLTCIEPTMLCSMLHPGPHVEQLQARLGGASRLAVVVQAPARHQRAVADVDGRRTEILRAAALSMTGFGCRLASEVHGAAGDQQSVQREVAARRHRHGQRVGQVGVPVQQANDRPGAVGRAQLQDCSPGLQRMLISSTYTPLSAISMTALHGSSAGHCFKSSCQRLSAWVIRLNGSSSPTR